MAALPTKCAPSRKPGDKPQHWETPLPGEPAVNRLGFRSHLHWDAGRIKQHYIKSAFSGMWTFSVFVCLVGFLVFPGIRNRTSSWSQIFLCTPGCELNREVKHLHLPTLPAGTAPALCVLHPVMQSSHPWRDTKMTLVQTPESCHPDSMHTGFSVAQEVENVCTRPGRFLHCRCYLFLVERLSQFLCNKTMLIKLWMNRKALSQYLDLEKTG